MILKPENKCVVILNEKELFESVDIICVNKEFVEFWGNGFVIYGTDIENVSKVSYIEYDESGEIPEIAQETIVYN